MPRSLGNCQLNYSKERMWEPGYLKVKLSLWTWNSFINILCPNILGEMCRVAFGERVSTVSDTALEELPTHFLYAAHIRYLRALRPTFSND